MAGEGGGYVRDLTPGDVVRLPYPPRLVAVLRIDVGEVAGTGVAVSRMEVRGPGSASALPIIRGQHEPLPAVGAADLDAVMRGEWDGSYQSKVSV
jgi:hypothetical protein